MTKEQIMSYTIMKHKQLPPHFGEEDSMSTLEIVELGILTLMSIALGAGFVWFIVEVTKYALTM